MSRTPDQLAREVRRGCIMTRDGRAALAELEAQAEAGQRYREAAAAALIAVPVSTCDMDGACEIECQNGCVRLAALAKLGPLAAELLPVAAAAPSPADQEEQA